VVASVSDPSVDPIARFVRPLAGIGGRAAASALRPVTATVRVAVGVGVGAERRVVDRVLDSGELERIVIGALNDARVQAAFERAVESEGAGRLVDSLFDSGLIDHFMNRLEASDGLWRLVDVIAQSPAVRAALSQQGLGFADQIGRVARDRSRRADHRVERAAGRLRPHPHDEPPTDPDARGP
jgi:hypothetical protein